MATKIPIEINLHQQSAYLTLKYEEQSFDLAAEYLRVHSPSAEVMGHGPGKEKVQVGKENVAIQNIVPVGNYAIQIIYDDGHDTGRYSWEYLYELGCGYADKWNSYLQKLKEAGYERVKQ